MKNPSNELPDTMMAVVTRGIGGTEMLDYCSVPTPVPGPDDVVIQVLAAGVNNTEVNTRLGWYSSAVEAGTNQTETSEDRSDGGWNEETPFPFIQGTDCCGRIVAAGMRVQQHRIGERVLVRSCMRTNGFGSPVTVWMGSDFDGAFAQYVRVPAQEAFAIESDWTDTQLATVPCAFGTAENMVHRAGVRKGMTVLIPGASGGVGSALIQLVKRRGAKAIAITSQDKIHTVSELGAETVLGRNEDLLEKLGSETVDIVIDNVGGQNFGAMLKVLKRGGYYVSSGAVAGPLVTLDMRDMYLKDISLLGCTAWDEPIFPNLISYIERNEIQPVVAAEYPLQKIAEAQEMLLLRQHIGSFVLVPPAD